MQSLQKLFDATRQFADPLLVDNASLQRLQFGFQRCFSFSQIWHARTQMLEGEQSFLICVQKTIDALLDSDGFLEQNFFAHFRRIRVLNFLNPPIYFASDQFGVLQHLDDLLPYELIQIVCADRTIAADMSLIETAIRIGTQAAIIVQLPFRRFRRRSVVRIPAFLANQNALQQGRLYCASRRKSFVAHQPLLGQIKSFRADNRRNWNRNPFLSWPLPAGAASRGKSAALAQRPGDSLSFRSLRFAETGRTLVGRIAQHRPHRRSLPRRFSFARGNALFFQPSSNCPDAQRPFRVKTVNLSDYGRLSFNHFVESIRGFRFLDVSIAIRRSAQHIHQPRFRAVSLSATAALGDLRALILSDHPLKLQKQPIFRGGGLGRFDENDLHAMPSKFLDEQNLIRILPAQPIRRIDQDRFNLSFGGQISQPLQCRPNQNRSAVALILKYPLRRNAVSLDASIIDERRDLTADRLCFLLFIRRDPSVYRRCFHPILQLELNILAAVSIDDFPLELRADMPEIISERPTDLDRIVSRPAAGSFQPCPSLLRKVCRARVTMPLNDSPVDLARLLMRRAKLAGSFTVKTIFRSGIGTAAFDFSAAKTYRCAWRREMRWRFANTTIASARLDSCFNSIHAPLMRRATWASGDRDMCHKHNTYYVHSSSVIPASPVRHAPLKLEVMYCVGGVISPLLANIFLHLAFDTWMRREHPEVPFERYADDVVVHCKTEEQAQDVKKSIEERLALCKLELNQEKTKIVYCKDKNRRGSYPNEKFDFLGYTFRPRLAKGKPSGGRGLYFVSFSPAVSNKAATKMRSEMRRWRLHLWSGQNLDDMARKCNPIIRGWINYYGRHYRSALHPVFNQLNCTLVKWAMRKYKRQRDHQLRATHWLGQVARREPMLFAHWQMLGLRPAAG